MQRIRVDRKSVKPKPRPEILPLDARDPEVVRAKRLLEREPLPPRAA